MVIFKNGLLKAAQVLFKAYLQNLIICEPHEKFKSFVGSVLFICEEPRLKTVSLEALYSNV